MHTELDPGTSIRSPRRGRRTQVLAGGLLGTAILVTLAACGGPAATDGPVVTPAPVTPSPTVAPTAAGTPAGPAPTADPFAFVAQFEGTYAGSWTNTTFGSTGPASIELAIDRAAGSVAFTITLGGNVFGNPSPKAEQLTALITPGAGLTFTSATFGETTISVDFAGGSPVVTMVSPDVPSPRIATFVATATITDPSTIELEYDVKFRDSTPDAHGTATLTRS